MKRPASVCSGTAGSEREEAEAAEAGVEATGAEVDAAGELEAADLARAPAGR